MTNPTYQESYSVFSFWILWVNLISMLLLACIFSIQIFLILIRDSYTSLHDDPSYGLLFTSYYTSISVYLYSLNLSLLLQTSEWLCACQIIIFQKAKHQDEIYSLHLMESRKGVLLLRPSKNCYYLNRETKLWRAIVTVIVIQLFL